VTVVASTGPRRCLLIGAVQDQVQFGCFVLHLGASWASFGLLSREGFSSGVPRVFPWPPLGAWVPLAPAGGRGRSRLFPLVLLILGRVQKSFGFHLPGISFRCRLVGPSASLR
jgi:hypothetical protein